MLFALAPDRVTGSIYQNARDPFAVAHMSQHSNGHAWPKVLFTLAPVFFTTWTRFDVCHDVAYVAGVTRPLYSGLRFSVTSGSSTANTQQSHIVQELCVQAQILFTLNSNGSLRRPRTDGTALFGE